MDRRRHLAANTTSSNPVHITNTLVTTIVTNDLKDKALPKNSVGGRGGDGYVDGAVSTFEPPPNGASSPPLKRPNVQRIKVAAGVKEQKDETDQEVVEEVTTIVSLLQSSGPPKLKKLDLTIEGEDGEESIEEEELEENRNGSDEKRRKAVEKMKKVLRAEKEAEVKTNKKKTKKGGKVKKEERQSDKSSSSSSSSSDSCESESEDEEVEEKSVDSEFEKSKKKKNKAKKSNKKKNSKKDKDIKDTQDKNSFIENVFDDKKHNKDVSDSNELGNDFGIDPSAPEPTNDWERAVSITKPIGLIAPKIFG